MAILSPTDTKGCRSISWSPWFVKPTLTPGTLTCQLILPLALPFWTASFFYNWNTTVYIVDGTQEQQSCVLKFSTAVPAWGELVATVIG